MVKAQKKESNRQKSIKTDLARQEKINEILIENFANLQKTMTTLALKFDNLSQQMSSLLTLFEVSAKSFADKLATNIPELQKDAEFLDKLDKLLDQNKTIAKGLTLMEEKLRERVYGGRPTVPQQPQLQRGPPQNYAPSMERRPIQ